MEIVRFGAEVSAHILRGGGVDPLSWCRRHPIDAKMTPANPTGIRHSWCFAVIAARLLTGNSLWTLSRNGKAPLGNRVRHHLGMMQWRSRTIDQPPTAPS
jgi:hypothetical protein